MLMFKATEMWTLCLLFSVLQVAVCSAVAQRAIPTGSSGNRWRSLSCYNGSSASCGMSCSAIYRRSTLSVSKTAIIIARINCSGSSNGKTQIKSSTTKTLQRLRNQYENCTRVWGNLEITFINQESLDEENADPATALQFLETIEEVTGYVLIYANDVNSISLPKLRIIWGDTLYYDAIKQTANLTFSNPQDGVGFFVYNNPNLEYIDVRELRSIERGKVAVAHNKYLCYWQQLPEPNTSAVDFGQLVGKNNVTDRLWKNFHATELKNFEMCDRNTNLCHPNCTNRHCWGPGADMCQIIYRNNCPSSCESEMCPKLDDDSQLCCHKACAAGCHGPRNDQCYACKSFEQDGACVEQCNGLHSYNHVTGMTEPHIDPKYTYNRHCVEQCPENMLIQGDHCVTRCKDGYHADSESNDRVCRECQGACPKRCQLNEPLTSEHIDRLINCTIIEGTITLLSYSMTEWVSFDGPEPRNVSGLTMDDLEKLSSIRVITDYLEVQMGTESPSSLSFLRNLKTIEGRRLSASRYTMLISTNDNLRELGLTSLKHVLKGRVYIGRNHALCLADSIKWDAIIKQQPEMNGEVMYKIIDNKNSQQCMRKGEICDAKCNSTMGCWGDGDRKCFTCANWRIGDQCVDNCPESGYYKVNDTRECMPCHVECDMCTGEGPHSCTSCKHVSMLHNSSNFECLSACPVTYYENGSQCQPCHPTCFEYGCTGPSNVPVDGGCKMCRYAEISQDFSSVVRCLPAPADLNTQHVCSAAGLTNYFRAAPRKQFMKLVDQYMCEKCDSVCSECDGYGNEVIHHNCKCVSYELKGNTNEERDRCVEECPVNSFLMKEKQGDKAGTCKSCHELCDPHSSCDGKMPNECHKCKYAGIHNHSADKFECLRMCPEKALFLDEDLFCYGEDRMAIRRAQKQHNSIIIGAGIAAFVTALLVFAVAVFISRNKNKEVKYNELSIRPRSRAPWRRAAHGVPAVQEDSLRDEDDMRNDHDMISDI